MDENPLNCAATNLYFSSDIESTGKFTSEFQSNRKYNFKTPEEKKLERKHASELALQKKIAKSKQHPHYDELPTNSTCVHEKLQIYVTTEGEFLQKYLDHYRIREIVKHQSGYKIYAYDERLKKVNYLNPKFLYEQTFFPVHAGTRKMVFKDGNEANFAQTNIELVTIEPKPKLATEPKKRIKPCKPQKENPKRREILPEGFVGTKYQNVFINKDGIVYYFHKKYGYIKRKICDTYYNRKAAMCVAIGTGGKIPVAKILIDTFFKDVPKSFSIQYKDGDYHNIDLNNLSWTISVRDKETMKKILEKHYPFTCKYCGSMTSRDICVCSKCYPNSAEKKKKNDLLKREKKLKKLEKINDGLSKINTEYLNEKYRSIIEMRRKGMTYAAIAKEYGCSKQYIQQLIKKEEDNPRIENMGTYPSVRKENIRKISNKYNISKEDEEELLRLIEDFQSEIDVSLYRKSAEILDMFPISAKGAFNSAKKMLYKL